MLFLYESIFKDFLLVLFIFELLFYSFGLFYELVMSNESKQGFRFGFPHFFLFLPLFSN
jgi:hypothetical protein